MIEPQVRESDVDEVKDWITQKAAKAARQVHEAVRIVAAIRSWADYEQHLIDTCAKPDCEDCPPRQWLLARLNSLLPDLPERRVDHGGEAGDGRPGDGLGP